MVGTTFRGRLGNNMYQYAYIRSVAERNGYDFCICNPTKQFDDIFPQLKIYEKSCKILNNKKTLNTGAFSNDFYNISDGVLTDGFFQHHKYFEDMPVKSWFKITLNDHETKLYNEIIDKYDPFEYVYIYFRGTDFNNIKQYHISPDWYKKAQEIGKKYIVITDDIETSKKFIIADDYISTNYKTDFKLLTSSNKLIIPVMSSFGWWGAWLSCAEIIIAPISDDECWHTNNKFVYI